MKNITGQNRTQLVLFPTILDATVEQDNEVRFINLFAESPDYLAPGLTVNHIENVCPAYDPKEFLKL